MEEQNSEARQTTRRLYKSSTDRIIDGVCGGIAEYLRVDATVTRLLIVAFSILSIGAGVILYLIAMVIIPTKPRIPEESNEGTEKVAQSAGGSTVTLVLGIVIVVIGLALFFDYYNLLPFTLTFHQFGKLALPVIFILIGGALLLGKERRSAYKGSVGDESIGQGVEKKKLARSVRNKKFAGVCGGLAEYLEVDPTIVRLAYVILAFASFGLALILYVVCAFIIPKEVY
jgi:phage shock protein C